MGLLNVLGIPRAFVLGGCMGCSTATAFGVTYPSATLGLLLHWPVGGVRWRQNGLDRFQAHVDFVKNNGLSAVVDLAKKGGELLGRTQGWAVGLHHLLGRVLRRDVPSPGPGPVPCNGGAHGTVPVRQGHCHRPGPGGAHGAPRPGPSLSRGPTQPTPPAPPVTCRSAWRARFTTTCQWSGRPPTPFGSGLSSFSSQTRWWKRSDW